MHDTVIFLGAGATKSVGGPLTDEILPAIVNDASSPDPTGRVPRLRQFLLDQFHVTPGSPSEAFPGLPMLMSLIDTALERRESLHPSWDYNNLQDIRECVELGIFDVLEEKLFKAQTTNHFSLFHTLYPVAAPPAVQSEPCVISTNYDLIADTAMMFMSESRLPEGGLPAYLCSISTDFYRDPHKPHFGKLLKLHGSLNWLYCRTCHRLEIGASDARKYLKILNSLVGPSLEQAYQIDGGICPTPNCLGKLRPLLIAPTHLKNYRNPHIAQVWYEAEQMLRTAGRVIFIGYSLPEDDVEIIYLLKRSLAHLTPSQITVVSYNPAMPPLGSDPIGRRYRTLFGDAIDWHPEGIDPWLPTAAASVP